MKILTVIPLAKGIPRDELSYFSAREVALGTLVTVPFGGRKIKAVVVDHNDVRDLKASIKSESFKLKNVSEIHTDRQLPANIFSAAQKTARFFAQPVGAIIETMVPKVIFEYYVKTISSGQEMRKITTDVQILQVPLNDRILTYKTMIRENLAKHSSTMIIAPTIVHAEKMFEHMKNGIEDRIAVLHGKKAKKVIEKSVKQMIESPDPVVVIATAPFSSIMRNDWNTIIIEESSSSHYRYEFGPKFDMRYFIEHQARGVAARLMFADTLIESNMRYRVQKKEIGDMRSTWHITRPENFTVLDMRPAEGEKKSFDLLHPETRTMIEKALAGKSKIVLLANRKGLAPLTTCSDCGTAVSCQNCNTPLVLHRKKSGETESRTYICHHCLTTTQPIDHCLTCGGSRLAMLGISTDRISDEIEKLFPNAKIFLLGDDDKTLAKTIKYWNKATTGILIGTHGILQHLNLVPFGCIVSIDSLLSLPHYTSSETSLHVILAFLEKITDSAILQTRTREHDAVRAIEHENLVDFMKNEIESRIQFNYPPSKVLVKISIDTKKTKVKEVTEYFDTILKPYDPDILLKKSKKIDRVIVQAIMKIDPGIWNDPESQIQLIMKDLSREFVRDVNADSVV